MLKLPKAFCWTRMGAESGQSLDAIILRKELERKANNGVFIWGIGNPLGNTIWKFVNSENNPTVLFSKIKSKPKLIDRSPSKVYLWKSFIDRENSIRELPKYSLVLSRANSERIQKSNHYALICMKKNEIKNEKWEKINFNNLKNYDSLKDRIGFSQVTAVVKTNGYDGNSSSLYEVEFSASLVDPYFVKLANPLDVPLKKINHLNDLIEKRELKHSEWCDFSLDFHKEIEEINSYRKPPTQTKWTDEY